MPTEQQFIDRASLEGGVLPAERAGPVKRGFTAPCPKCNENTVQLSLADLEELYCTACEETMSLTDVRALVAGWQKVLTWIDAAPLSDGAEG